MIILPITEKLDEVVVVVLFTDTWQNTLYSPSLELYCTKVPVKDKFLAGSSITAAAARLFCDIKHLLMTSLRKRES